MWLISCGWFDVVEAGQGGAGVAVAAGRRRVMGCSRRHPAHPAATQPHTHTPHTHPSTHLGVRVDQLDALRQAGLHTRPRRRHAVQPGLVRPRARPHRRHLVLKLPQPAGVPGARRAWARWQRRCSGCFRTTVPACARPHPRSSSRHYTDRARVSTSSTLPSTSSPIRASSSVCCAVWDRAGRRGRWGRLDTRAGRGRGQRETWAEAALQARQGRSTLPQGAPGPAAAAASPAPPPREPAAGAGAAAAGCCRPRLQRKAGRGRCVAVGNMPPAPHPAHCATACATSTHRARPTHPCPLSRSPLPPR